MALSPRGPCGAAVLLGALPALLIAGCHDENATCDPPAVTPFVTTDFVELGRISEISRFRSAAGHDYSDACESCRSMKHYFAPYDQYRNNDSLVVRSPVEGTIVGIDDEGHGASPPGKNKQVWIRSSSHRDYTFILFHLDLASSAIVEGKMLTAGERIGTARMYYPDLDEYAHDFDIAVRVHSGGNERYVSWFQTITDDLFVTYQARGVASRADLIIDESARDSDRLTCNGQQFNSTGLLPSWVTLTAPR